MKRGSYSRPSPTKAQQRQALQTLLVMRAELDGVDIESLSRSYGVPILEVTAMLEAERSRRRLRA